MDYICGLRYLLGLDMGATSIGWSVFDLQTRRVIDFGVRIFDDGREAKSKASLCVKRREARGSRRLTNRKHIKTNELINVLVYLGLFPENEIERKSLKTLNPYRLRTEALDKKLDVYHLGRAIFHLAQRKGFKSNRKDDKEEGGKLKKGFEELKSEIEKSGARTYGEFLYKKHLSSGDSLRLKNTFDDNGKFKGGLFPFREVYQAEFDAIWAKQKEFYPQILTNENKKIIENIIFFQRPLREQEMGFCQFEEGEKRIPKAHPLFQEFRIWQNVLNLEFAADTSPDYDELDAEKRNALIELLQNPQNVKPNAQGIIVYSNLKKELGLNKNGLFNFEKKSNIDSGLEKGMIVNRTQHAINNSKYFAKYWNEFSEGQKGEIINVISRPQNYIDFPKTKVSIEEEDKIIIAYLCEKFGITQEAAKELLIEIPLEEGYAALSEKAVKKILPAMKCGMIYADACKEVGYHHSVKEYTKLDKLPYYGEILAQSCLGQKNNSSCVEEKFGRINNATVHVALNQIRHLINELIEIYGKPFDISVEYARDLGASTQERKKMSDTRDKNEAENQRIIKEMKEKICEKEYSKGDIQKYKIWKNMGIAKGESPLTRECPFSGEIISVGDLLNGQKFQIEHIIPFSRSLDDSLDNKVIASIDANRYKGNRTPYEAFGESKDGYDWKAIQRRAKKLSLEQQWRFSKDAMQKFEKKEGPIARSLNDTRYMTRLLQGYLRPIVVDGGKESIQSVVGSLTSMVRKAWGLNLYKNKEEKDEYRVFHNHHAIDAIIVSAITRHQITEVSKRLKNVKQLAIEEFKGEFYKFRDKNVSKEEKSDLRKRIKDFTTDKEEGIINQYIKIPESFSVDEIVKRVENINISHKPSLKNIKQENSTIGKLHEDTAYGLKSFVDGKSLKAEFICSNKIVEKDVSEYIPIFYKKEDKQAYYDAYKEWFILDKKAGTMIAKTKEEKTIKVDMAQKENEAIQNLRIASEKAFKWFVGGGNFCAEIYEINENNKIFGVPTNDRGEWKTEIVSNYNATIRNTRGEDISYWRYKYPNAKRIMTLNRNDMVIATFTKEQAFAEDFPKGIQKPVREKFTKNANLESLDVLFRVKKMTNGTIYFTPHNVAKEEADTKSWIASAGAIQRYKTRKVFVTFTGRIQNAK